MSGGLILLVVLILVIPLGIFHFIQSTDFFMKSKSTLLVTCLIGALCFVVYDLMGITVWSLGSYMGHVLVILKIPMVPLCMPFYYYAVDKQRKESNSNTRKISYQIIATGTVVGLIPGFYLSYTPFIFNISRYLTVLGFYELF